MGPGSAAHHPGWCFASPWRCAASGARDRRDSIALPRLADTPSHPRGASARVLLFSSRPRWKGAGKAGRRLAPACPSCD